MKHKVYSVRDAKTSFAAPFVDASDSSAERGFHYAYLNSGNMVSFCPSDFSLYRIGEFDTDSGILEPLIPPVFICDATKFVKNRGDEVEE